MVERIQYKYYIEIIFNHHCTTALEEKHKLDCPDQGPDLKRLWAFYIHALFIKAFYILSNFECLRFVTFCILRIPAMNSTKRTCFKQTLHFQVVLQPPIISTQNSC